MASVVADKSRIDGGVVYTWKLTPGCPAQPCWAGPSPIRMVQASGYFAGARVSLLGSLLLDGPYHPVPTDEGVGPVLAVRAGGAALSVFGLWLRPELTGGDTTTEVTVTVALLNPGHQRPME